MLVSHNPFILPFPPFRAYQLHSSFVWKLSSPFPHLQSLPLTAHSFRLWLIPSFYLTVIQYQENATLFLPEATGSPTPILPRLPSVDDLLHEVYIGGESCSVRPYRPFPHRCQKYWRLSCQTLTSQLDQNRSKSSTQSAATLSLR